MPMTVTFDPDKPIVTEQPGGTPSRRAKPETEDGSGERAYQLTDKIKTKQGEFTIQDLLEAKAQLEQQSSLVAGLGEYRQAVQALLDPEVEDPSVKSKALRYVLTAEGYSPEEVDRQAAALAAGGEPEAEPAGEPPIQEPKGNMRPNEGTPDQGAYAQLRQALIDQEATTNRIRTQLLKKELDLRVGQILDSDPEVAKLVVKVKEVRGDEADEGIQFLREDIAEKAVKALSKKVALTGQKVQEEWVEDAVKSAAKEVRQRSLFGSPDRIGKAPTVESGGDRFKNRTPVPAPEFKKGDSMAEVSNKVRGHATDLLTRLAAQSGTGETKA